MNERIKELAKQAQQYAECTTPQGLEWLPAFTEKFAELIVRECINEVEGLQISKYTSQWDRDQHWNRAIAHTALHIRDHFGVEE